jgi:glyoxylase-like metal-dependent hydrolase (beta-lactamase superfamily II)
VAEKLIHEILPVGLLQCNCSILGDPATREAIVVDPGEETERILEIVRAHQLSVRVIVSTHTHIDHVGGLAGLHQPPARRC